MGIWVKARFCFALLAWPHNVPQGDRRPCDLFGSMLGIPVSRLEKTQRALAHLANPASAHLPLSRLLRQPPTWRNRFLGITCFSHAGQFATAPDTIPLIRVSTPPLLAASESLCEGWLTTSQAWSGQRGGGDSFSPVRRSAIRLPERSRVRANSDRASRYAAPSRPGSKVPDRPQGHPGPKSTRPGSRPSRQSPRHARARKPLDERAGMPALFGQRVHESARSASNAEKTSARIAPGPTVTPIA
jgi:hypothetical protein